MRNSGVVACVSAVVAVGGLAMAASAVTNPFTETFSSSSANWSSALAFTPLTYPAAGGPDGSGYGSRTISFAGNADGEQPLLFRGQSNFNSSGNAFVGNWITSGVNEFSFSVRHDAAVPVAFFARWSPAAGPGVVAIAGAALPNTWTTFTIAIDPATAFIYEGTTFATFGNVARVQVGVLVNAALAGNASTFNFDIDNVSIVPTPGAAGVVGLLALAGLRRRR